MNQCMRHLEVICIQGNKKDFIENNGCMAIGKHNQYKTQASITGKLHASEVFPLKQRRSKNYKAGFITKAHRLTSLHKKIKIKCGNPGT